MARRRRDLEDEVRPDSLEHAREELRHLSVFIYVSTSDLPVYERMQADLAKSASDADDPFSRLEQTWAVIDRHGVRDWAEAHLSHMRRIEQRRYDQRGTR